MFKTYEEWALEVRKNVSDKKAQKTMAEAIGCSVREVENIVNASVVARRSMADKISSYLEIDYVEYISEANPKTVKMEKGEPVIKVKTLKDLMRYVALGFFNIEDLLTLVIMIAEGKSIEAIVSDEENRNLFYEPEKIFDNRMALELIRKTVDNA